MNLETVIAEKVHALPNYKQAKVLEFVEDLEKVETNGNEAPSDNSIEAKKTKRLSIIGIGRSDKGDIASRAEEILMEGITKRSGWTLKEPIVD